MPEEVMEQPAPSLAEAYESGQNNIEREERTEPLPKRNTKLSEEADTQRELEETVQQTERAKPRREPTLQEALEGTQPAEAEQFSLPAEFAAYSADDISAVCGLLGLEEPDLKEPRFAALALKELEAAFAQGAEDEQETDDAEEEGEPESEEAEEKPAEKPADAEAKKPPIHLEMQPEEITKYVEATWEKSQQISHPQMSKLFEDTLAGILETPPESRAMLREVCEVLNYAGTR